MKPIGPRAPHRGLAAEARDLHVAAAALFASVLVDSAIEHYRGSFENPAMFAPLATSALGLAAGAGAALGARAPSRARAATFALALVVGAAGLGFHLYNVAKRPGGLDWLNLFYGAPIGAPAALALAGVIGAAADHLAADDGRSGAPRIAGAPRRSRALRRHRGRPCGHRRRGRAAAFPRQLPESVHVVCRSACRRSRPC